MDNMSETMVLKRKRSPTPQGWINPSEQLDEPTSPSSSNEEVCCELTKPKKKKKKQVKFNGVTVYYFQRSQGFTCVPSQGGSTLGMEHIHDFKENYSLNAFALEQDRQHRELLKEQLLERKQRQMFEQNDPELLNKSIQEIAENELAKINVDEYYFLQPVTTKRRRLMLRSAGVHKIESWEKSELKKIRLSREKCGCECKIVCNPSTCACNLAGIKCQVDRLSFPCGCSKDGCGNTTGRVEFNPIKVRTHFLHTLMRLEVENGQDIETTVNRTDCNNDTNYTKLENSICLDENSDRVLDHGQCKECDSIPYTDYNDQYTAEQYTADHCTADQYTADHCTADQYLNGQNTTKEYTHQLSSFSVSAPNNFSCSNTVPLDIQSQTNFSQQLPCVYDGESKHITLNSSTNSCNVPRPVISEYDSSTSEESATSESDSEPPYVNHNISLENSGFSSNSADDVEKSILQTSDSSPDQQYTKLMPLDLSHALDDYCEDAPTYMQLSSRTSPQLITSYQTSQDGFCSDNAIINHQTSFYTHLPYSTNMCKLEKTCTQNLTSQDQLNEYNMNNGHHSVATENNSTVATESNSTVAPENNSTLAPLNHTESSLYVDEATIEYFHESSQSSQQGGDNVMNVAYPYVESEQYKTDNKSHPSNDRYLVNQEIQDIYLHERIDSQSESLLQSSGTVKDLTQEVEAEGDVEYRIALLSSANGSVGKHQTCNELMPEEEYLVHDGAAKHSHNIQTECNRFPLDRKGCNLTSGTNSQLHFNCQFLPEIQLFSRNEELLSDSVDEVKTEEMCDKEHEKFNKDNVTVEEVDSNKTEKRDEKENTIEEFKDINETEEDKKENVGNEVEDINMTEGERDEEENTTEEFKDINAIEENKKNVANEVEDINKNEGERDEKENANEEFKDINEITEKDEKEDVTKEVEDNNKTEEERDEKQNVTEEGENINETEKNVIEAVEDINETEEQIDEKENATVEVENIYKTEERDEKENCRKEYEGNITKEDSKKGNITEEKWDTGLEKLIPMENNLKTSIEIAVEPNGVEVLSNGILPNYNRDNCQFEGGCLSSNISPINQSSSGELSFSTEIKCCKNVCFNEAVQQSPGSNTVKSRNEDEFSSMLPSGPSSISTANCFSGICHDTVTSTDGINTIFQEQLTTNCNDSHSPLVGES